LTEKDLLEFVQEKSIINRALRVATRQEIFTGVAQEIGWGVLVLRVERMRPGIRTSQESDSDYERVAIGIDQITSISF
jgi:hypothetical protein